MRRLCLCYFHKKGIPRMCRLKPVEPGEFGIHITCGEPDIIPVKDYLLSELTALAAVRPETKISTMALPPRRLPP